MAPKHIVSGPGAFLTDCETRARLTNTRLCAHELVLLGVASSTDRHPSCGQDCQLTIVSFLAMVFPAFALRRSILPWCLPPEGWPTLVPPRDGPPLDSTGTHSTCGSWTAQSTSAVPLLRAPLPLTSFPSSSLSPMCFASPLSNCSTTPSTRRRF